MRKVVAYFWDPADPRTYALVRMALAIAGLANWIQLWPVRHEYFASTGMVSMEGVRGTAQGGLYASIFYVVSSQAGVTAIFLCAAAAMLALGLGFWTRTAAALVFAWHLSYSDRAFPILHSWDALLRIYSWLVLISPKGRVWSLDRALTRGVVREALGRETAPVYGLRMMRFQLVIVYVTTFWLKAPDEYWRNGQVCAYFNLSFYSHSPNDLFLVRHEWLSALQTYLSLAIEASVPWLLAMKRTRFFGLVAGFALHFMIGATSILAIFSVCMIPPYLAFLDGDDIDRLMATGRQLADRVLGARGKRAGVQSGS